MHNNPCFSKEVLALPNEEAAETMLPALQELFANAAAAAEAAGLGIPLKQLLVSACQRRKRKTGIQGKDKDSQGTGGMRHVRRVRH